MSELPTQRAAPGAPARLLRAHALWIALVTAVTVGGALTVTLLIPPTYQSTSSVVVEPHIVPNITPITPDMGTETQVARSGVVVGNAAETLGVGQEELRSGLDVSAEPEANVLTFAYTDSTPARARARAQALAEAYVAYRSPENGSVDEDGGVPRPIATLVTDASLPTKPHGYALEINLTAGVLFGLTLGIGTAALRDRWSDRLRGRADFEHHTGVPVLATVPAIRRRPPDEGELPVMVGDPDSAAAEAYRALRTHLQSGPGGTTPATVLVTSAEEAAGRTTVVANLSIALALSGMQVVAVDGDLRSPRLHEVFDTRNLAGLAGLLLDVAVTQDLLEPTGVPGLRLLPAGTRCGEVTDLLEPVRLRGVFGMLHAAADVVVVDSPPVLEASDALALAAVSDGILFVANGQRASRNAIVEAFRPLRALDAHILGGVLMAGLSRPRRRTARQRPAALSAPATTEPESAEKVLAQAGETPKSKPTLADGRTARAAT